MPIAALNSAATGLKALSTKIDVIANNLANTETQAFKRSRVNFEDLYYNAVRQPGVTSGSDSSAHSPMGLFVGSGVRVTGTQLDISQGSPEATENPLDVMIQGDGWFRVKTQESVGGGYAYTRNGAFTVNDQGQLILSMGDSYRLDPPINIPQNVPAKNITISSTGDVQVLVPGATATTTVGKISLFNFVNPQGFEQIGGSLFLETPASGPATESIPGENGTGSLQSGFLEGSNVDPVKELVGLIKTQRAFELNSQSIQTADQALQTIANLRRG